MRRSSALLVCLTIIYRLRLDEALTLLVYRAIRTIT